ncbi:MAG: glycosyltransferase family 4 protein [Fusobacteriaceae bacterium]
MKIIYLTPSICNYGGMERVLKNKLNYFIEKYGYEIHILTTEDRDGQEPFYEFSKKIKVKNLNINYRELKKENLIKKVIGRIRKKRLHQEEIQKYIDREKPDICISTLMDDFPFFHRLKTDAKKVGEIHFTKNHTLINLKSINASKLRMLNAKLVNFMTEKRVRKLDKFITLTNGDYLNWKHRENIEVIGNSISFFPENRSELKNKKIISVGRYTHEKGYDLLVEVWKKIEKKNREWRCEIYGSGEDLDRLNLKIDEYGLKNIRFNPPTQEILEKYLESSIYVMTSRNEGLPLVLIEAMSCGLPVVSFDCPCGPRDLIEDGENGYLIPVNDIELMSEKILDLIHDHEKICRFSENGRKKASEYSEEKIMEKWKKLFTEINKRNT